MQLTTKDYFSLHLEGNEAQLTDEVMSNAVILLERTNILLNHFNHEVPGQPYRNFTSGWRPLAINENVKGAAKNSWHVRGGAGDLWDRNRALAQWLINKTEDELSEFQLWFEDMRATPTWVHCQIQPPASKQRFFIPDANWAERLMGHPLTITSLGG